jgi:hypothetical protein
MSFLNRLKTKSQLLSQSTYSVTQEITIPIYERNFNGIVDSEDIAKKCLAIRDSRALDTSINHFLTGAWKSPYYRRGQRDDMFEEFSSLIKPVEDTLNALPSYGKAKTRFEILEWWIIIYNKGASIDWHDHIPVVDAFTRFSATYYPMVPDNAQPILFKNKGEILEVPVTQNKILYFPSMTYHSVSECVSDEPRIMVGFNFEGLR